MYNLNCVPTILGVQSSREIISGGTRTKKVEYHCYRVYLNMTLYCIVLAYVWRSHKAFHQDSQSHGWNSNTERPYLQASCAVQNINQQLVQYYLRMN
jgi:hypothetical protein